jgi:hypothetical protein
VTDLIFLAILVAFFAVAVLFVGACDRIIGPDLEADVSDDASDTPEPERAAA